MLPQQFGTLRLSRLSILLLISILGLGLLLPLPALAYRVFNTHNAVIYYNDAADLIGLERALNFTQVDSFGRYYTQPASATQDTPSPRLAAKIDGLLVKVRVILKLWPSNLPKLRIYLLKNGRQVRQRHLLFQFHRVQSIMNYSPLEAFYENRTSTIFLSLDDAREGVLAHEMAHFVLCHAFPVPPPAAQQERLAQYVETSLD